MHGMDRAMIIVSDALNVELNALGIELRWSNIPNATTNPCGQIGHFVVVQR